MAEKQSAPRRNTNTSTNVRSTKERQAPPRRNDVIRCEKCGEDYSVTYKRCPFCDERPVRGGSGGRRMAGNTRGGGYGGPVNPIQIVGLVISMILIIAALFIVFTKLGPLLFKGDSSSGGSSVASQSSSISSSAGTSSSSGSQTGSSSGDGADVTPSVQVQAISLSRQDFTLTANETYQIIAAVSPADVTEPVVWTSSNPSVATVDEYGNVTNVNTGSTREIVTITATCGGQSAECIVRCNGSGTGGSTGGSTGGAVSPNSTGTIVNAGSGLNVRSGPGSSYEKIASIQNGNKVIILEDAGGGWYKIDYGNGKTGYVSSDYVSVG